MLPDPGVPQNTGSSAAGFEAQAIKAIALQIAEQATVAAAAHLLVRTLSRVLDAPIAILSRDQEGWRLEAHALPDSSAGTALTRITAPIHGPDPVDAIEDESGSAWSAVALGSLSDRDWAVLLPGQSSTWASRPGFEQLIETVGGSLSHVANAERADYADRLHRRLHALSLRLARENDPCRLYRIVLDALASQVMARTGALAIFNPDDHTLRISATLGYPAAIVEHLRIQPGEGLIGSVFESGKAIIGHAGRHGPKRLRYRTDSYMVLPVLAGTRPLAVIALTDRTDERRFDARDFTAARLMAATAAPAFSREGLRTQLASLTELATVDAVTGLFNRRYFETRLEAEAERARRQRQDLALLLIDIDDFKRVNDTRGHLEGDRILRDVADLLRAGVRIFDICARYGGEEFVIVMPGATETVARQVAERIRIKIERSFGHDSPPVTVSIGVGMLTGHRTADELIDVADRALIAAKKAGKNLVMTATPDHS